MIMHAKQGDTVKVHYTGSLDDGTVFDSSKNRDPLEFTIGGGQVIKGFDDAAEGLAVGESVTVHIPAEEAYGPARPEMVLDVPRTQFPPDITPEIGQKLQVPHPEAGYLVVTVTEVTEDNVKLDANHELAGKALNFDIQLVEIV